MSEIEIISNQPKIQRVMPLLLQLEKNKDDYFPEAASFGPYHHGQPKLAFVEAFKPKAVALFTSDDGRQDEKFYYDNILEIIQEVRDCYVQDISIAKYSYPNLAKMMLRDASLFIVIMKAWARIQDCMVSETFEHLGMLTFTVLWRDLILLDNQIPLRVVKLLVDLRYGEGEYQKLLYSFMSDSIFRKYSKKPATSREKSNTNREPLHILEAFHRLVVKAAVPTCKKKSKVAKKKKKGDDDLETGAVNDGTSHISKKKRNKGMIHGLVHRLQKSWLSKKSKTPHEEDEIHSFVHSFRTVKDLKANGIYFKPSPTRSLKDVNFRSHFFYARLELPEWYVSVYTKAFFKNLVAYELSPNSPTQWEVASYINLMKSLIEGPEDVKELRERRILFNTMGSDEEVLNVYKGINTFGAENYEVFKEVKDRIEAHYNSIIKRWMAEFFHNNFRSPWTAIAFLTAFAVLTISAAQLYYAMHRRQSN